MKFLVSTKINRIEYSGFFLICLAVLVLENSFLIPQLKEGNMLFIGRIFVLINLVLSVSAIFASIFRLRDIGHSVWLFLLMFIPIVNLVFPFYLLFKKGKYD
jgi:uncharacterized membrane protein YhaH (DUF805 family)